MKIGILTFHCAHNYGAVLQCYALQEYLKSLNHEVYVIDYRPTYILDTYKTFNWKRCISKNPILLIKKTYTEIVKINTKLKRSTNFNLFINKKLNLLSISKLSKTDLDYIIIGSDQVWNTKLTHGFDHYYWGNFNKNSKTQLISYAASIEEFWKENLNTNAIDLLKRFSHISVREKEAAEYLKKLLPQRSIATVVDPTLLIDKTEWNKIAQKPPIRKPYILLYQVRSSTKALNIAKELAKRKNIELIYLSANANNISSKESQRSSIEEFIGWFKYAEYIVCTSFHGTVFSYIFKKPFYSIKLNDGKDSRVESLINILHKENCFIEYLPTNNINSQSEYTNMKDINEAIEKSKEYLQNALQNKISL